MNGRRVRIFFLVIAFLGIIYGCSGKEDEERPLVSEERATPPPAISEERGGSREVKGEEERALKIGVIGPETGEEADYGLSTLEGVMMAAKVLNSQGGINGKAIEILHYDNKGSRELTEDIASLLIQQKVIAIFTAPTGWSTFVPTHLANETHTLLISIGTRRRIGKSGPYVFRNSLPDESAIDELIRFSTERLGFMNYALITSSNYDYSLELSSLFKRMVSKHGGRIILETDTYDTYSGKRDLKGVIEMIKNTSEPLQAIIYTGEAKEGASLAKGIKKAGLQLPIIGGEDLFTEEYLKKGGEAVIGTLLYTTFAPDDNSPLVVKFVEDYKRERGKIPNRFVALAYDTLMLLTEAIKQVGSTHPSKVRDALLKMKDFKGVTGRTAFTPEGEPIKEPFIYRVEGGKRFTLLN